MTSNKRSYNSISISFGVAAPTETKARVPPVGVVHRCCGLVPRNTSGSPWWRCGTRECDADVGLNMDTVATPRRRIGRRRSRIGGAGKCCVAEGVVVCGGVVGTCDAAAVATTSCRDNTDARAVRSEG